jgi:hypothetical protein
MSSLSLFEEDQHIEKDQFIQIQKHFQTFSYNEEQKKFIEAPLSNLKLLGIPGGGKTQSVIGKILFHYLTGDFTKNTDYIILTFSKRTNLEFLHKGMNIFDEWKENFFHSKNVRTIHSLASKLHYDSSSSSEELNTMQDTVIISAIFKIDEDPEVLKTFEETKDLKVIFVDEAQDLSGVQYDFLMCLSHHLSIPIIMIGDPNQNIYQFQKGSDKYLLNHSGFTHHLIQNYRSTPSIINLINYFRPWTQLTPRMVAGKEYTVEENIKPIFFTGSIEEILKNIVDEIRKSPYPRENIAIIGPVKKSKPILDTYKNIGLSLVVNKLKEEKISFKKHYEDSIVENHFEESLSSREEGYINLYTVHGAKGLEFDQVFLINFHTTTFGILPTEEKYREYKYLWYVGLSRAKKNLRVYVDEKKIPWYDLKICPTNYFKTENKKLHFPRKIEFREEVEPNFFELASLMKNKQYIDDEVFYQFEKLLSFKIKKEPLFELEESTTYIHKYKEYQPLYTLFLNQLFIYFYELKHNRISFFIQNYQKMIENTIVIPKQFTKGYKELKVRIPNIDKNLLLFGELYELKNSFKWNEEQLLNYLYGIFEGDMKKEFFMFLENDVFKYPKKELEDAVLFLHIYKNYPQEERDEYKKTLIKYLFQLSLFIFQSEYELGTLWVKDFKEELDSLSDHIDKIIDLSQKDTEEYQFNVGVEHPKLPIIGEVMMKKENRIVDLKFSKTIQKKHIYELIILSHILDLKWKNPEIEIWNFYQGEKVKVVMDFSSVNLFLLLQVLSNSIKKKLKNMIFILDIEIVGEGEEIDMIQIHMEEMTTGIVVSTGYVFPEKMDNLYKYYNSHKVLSNCKNIDQIRDELEYILEICDIPIIMSHNVYTIDQKIFEKNHIFKDFSKIKWIDTRQLLKFYMNEELAKEEIFHIYDEYYEEEIDETDNKNQVYMLKKIITDVAKIEERDILSLCL